MPVEEKKKMNEARVSRIPEPIMKPLRKVSKKNRVSQGRIILAFLEKHDFQVHLENQL